MRRLAISCVIVLLLSGFDTELIGGSPKYAETDKHALAASAKEEQSLDSLAKYLAGPCKSDTQKVRVIYRWIADRVSYDLDGLKNLAKVDNSPASVLKSRKAVCAGYAALYADLGKRIGLDVKVITGHAKGGGYVAGRPLDQSTRHDWNAVKIDGKWQLLEATWGAGGPIGGKFVKAFGEAHFLAPPDQFIFRHFPDDSKWQLLEKPWTKEQFFSAPLVRPEFFALGFTPTDVMAAAKKKSFAGFPDLFAGARDSSLRAIKAPVEKRLKDGDEIEFAFSSEEHVKLVVVNAGNRTFFKKDEKRFSATVQVTKGELIIVGSRDETATKFEGLLRYVVE